MKFNVYFIFSLVCFMTSDFFIYCHKNLHFKTSNVFHFLIFEWKHEVCGMRFLRQSIRNILVPKSLSFSFALLFFSSFHLFAPPFNWICFTSSPRFDMILPWFWPWFALVRRPPCELNISCTSTTAESRAKIW